MLLKRVENGLIISMNKSERRALANIKAEDEDRFESDEAMFDIFDDLIANSEWDWISPEEIGALTSAPILGTRDEDGNVKEAYAFMSYQVRSLQSDLLEDGKAFLEGGRSDQ